MRIVFQFILCACTFPFLFSKVSQDIYTGIEDVTVVSTLETKNCFISYVTINGQIYLLKQKKDFKKQLAVIRDALAAYVAAELRIAHRVEIIDPTVKFPGKIKAHWPATLHTLAQGETVRKQPKNKYSKLRLRQFWAMAPTFEEKGLTKLIVEHMTWHRQLPEIVALDLIIGNSDRHCGNLCYDEPSDSFCAIDMDDTFNKDLCILAYKKLQHMMHEDHVVFTKDEIRSLTHMRNTLKFLTRRHTPQDLIEKLHYFAKKAGFGRGGKMHDARIDRKLAMYEATIVQTYMSAHKLIALLDAIVSCKNAL
jgi:hypothetical protein